MGRRRKNNVYRHFLLQVHKRKSTCLLCFKTLKTTHGSNLMHHLKFMHNTEYEQTLLLNQQAVSQSSVSAVSNEETHSEGLGVEVDVEKFFSLEKGAARARCDVCQASVETKNLMSHLQREHPKMLKAASDYSDADDIEDNLYQEVVYLYDSDSKSTNVPKPTTKMTASTPNPPQRARQKTRAERDSKMKEIANRKRRRTEESTSSQADEFSEELDNFGKYVTCLMKTVPRDLSAQLQMEIINLIMTAKIRNMSKPSTSALTSVEKTSNLSVVDSCGFDKSMEAAGAEERDENFAPPSPESNIVDSLKTE